MGKNEKKNDKKENKREVKIIATSPYTLKYEVVLL